MINHIDLTTTKVKAWDPSRHFIETWIGGRGFNSRILYCFKDDIPATWDDPSNVIVISPGRLCGTSFPSSGRTTISVLKSPVSDLFSDGNFGGHFGPALRVADIDSLVITGKLEQPGYMHITKYGRIKFYNLPEKAMSWGYHATKGFLESAHKNAKVLAIGHGGGRGCFSAVVNCDDRVAGGGGSGAVMGAKNLKAIVVDYELDSEVPVKHAANMKFIADDAEQHIKNHPVYDTFKTYGTTSLVEIHSGLKYFPTFNWMKNTFRRWKDINGQSYLKYELELDENHLSKQDELSKEGKLGCRNCPIVCSNQNKIEYETLNCLGSKIGISDLRTIVMLNTVYFNDAGLDVIETTSIISTLMELSERGIIDKEIKWGDVDFVVNFLREFLSDADLESNRNVTLGACFKRGFVEGLQVAEEFGLLYIDWFAELSYEDIYDKYYVQSKGKALSGVFPNEANKGVALALATSSRGADHLRSLPTLATYASWYMGKGGFKKLLKLMTVPLRSANLMKSDVKFLVGDLWKTYETVFDVPRSILYQWKRQGFLLDKRINKGWGSMIKFTQSLYAMSDSLGTCRFTSPWRFGIGPSFWKRALRTIGITNHVGNELDELKLLQIGHNINCLEKDLLYHYGITIIDQVPRKFFKGRGALKRETFEEIYADYCTECGFTPDGRPKSLFMEGMLTGDYADRDMIKYFTNLGG